MAVGRTNAGGAKKLSSVPLSSFNLGSIVRIRENDLLREFYVAKHGYPTAGNGRTLLVRRYIHSERQWHSSNVNAYATCTLDAWFNGDYFNSLPADIRDQITAVSIPYTPGNGNTAVSSLSRRVFALSGTELGGSSGSLNVEGTALAIASTLNPATDSARVAKIQWTRSPRTDAITASHTINASGSLSNAYCSTAYGVRPAFTLPSNALVYQIEIESDIVVVDGVPG